MTGYIIFSYVMIGFGVIILRHLIITFTFSSVFAVMITLYNIAL